ncbi:MAG TPA: carbohydrate ABC transporter permease [Castellaniella sp.]|nr:carbohydrate ABC transporter permease [Castellaniella sp.]
MLDRYLASLGRGLIYGLIIIWSAVPILFIVVSSIMPAQLVFRFPPTLMFTPTLEHYFTLWRQWEGFFPALSNSLIVAAAATLFSALVSFLAGYAYSRYASRWLASTALYLIAIRMLPPIVVTLPLFPLADYLGMNDTHLVLIVLYSAFWVSLFTMIMKTFIDEVPDELDEAALMDGASRLQTLFRVILPLTLQGMVAGGLFVFVYSWNEFLFALIFVSQKAQTAPLLISQVMGGVDGTEWGVLFAGVTVQFLPVIALVVILQRYLVAGLTAGAVKG